MRHYSGRDIQWIQNNKYSNLRIPGTQNILNPLFLILTSFHYTVANCAPTGSTTPLSISINISALLCIPHTETCLKRRELAASEETWNAMASYIWSDIDVIKPAEGKERNQSVRRRTPRQKRKMGVLSKRVHDPSKLLRSASTWQWIGTRVLFALRKKL